ALGRVGVDVIDTEHAFDAYYPYARVSRRADGLVNLRVRKAVGIELLIECDFDAFIACRCRERDPLRRVARDHRQLWKIRGCAGGYTAQKGGTGNGCQELASSNGHSGETSLTGHDPAFVWTIV